MAPQSDLKLVQGTLDVLVLSALAQGPRHGYAVASWIRETSGDSLQIEEGALYTSLHRLERRKLVLADWGLSDNNRRAKFYGLTAAGTRYLEDNSKRWQDYASAVARVLHASGAVR